MKRKQLSLALLLLLIGTSLVTGTYAVYTKSFPFNGTITKVSSEIPPAPSDNEDIINKPNGDNVNVDDNGNVSIKQRGDFLRLMDLPGNDYKVEADISNFKAANAFGLYIDGYYDHNDQKIYADVIQFVDGKLEIRRKTFKRSYDKKGNIIVTEEGEGTYSAIATKEDVASVYTAPNNKGSMHLSVIMKSKVAKGGTLVVVPEVYINDVLVPNQVYPEREIIHTGNKAYIGYRSWWGGTPDVVFENLKVSPLDTPIPEGPDVIIPDIGNGTGSNPDITVDPGTGEVTIKNTGDYVFAAKNVTDSSYVIKVQVKLNQEAPDGLEEQLKGFGIYIDGVALPNGSVNTDCLYFTNNGGVNQLNLGTYSLVPTGNAIFDRIALNDDVKVTTQGETSIQWDDFKLGFNIYIAVKGDPLTGKKQVRLFVSDHLENKFRETTAYYDTPWTGLPPIRSFLKTNDRIYVGYHANNSDGRYIEFNNFSVHNGLSSIPSGLLHKYGW